MGSKSLLARGKEERFASRSIRTSLILSFTILFVSVLVLLEVVYIWGVPFTQMSGRRDQQRSEVSRSLNLIADLKKERLLRWIEERRDDIHVTADNEFTSTNVGLVLEAFHRFVTEGFEGAELWARVRGEENSWALLKYLENIISAYGVYNRIQIVDAETGMIVLSTNEADLGSDGSKRLYFTEIQKGYNEYISDITLDNLEKQPTFHLVRPICDGSDRVIAILLMEVNVEDVLKPILHTGEGLGENGEALLVNQEVSILTSLKHPLVDGSRAEPLKYQIRATPAIRAAGGEEGVIESLDYRGEPVLAAYRHLIVSPEVRWGLIVKRDRKELFAPLRREESFAILISLIGVFVIVVATIMLSGKITRPIEELSHLASRVIEGDLDVLASVESLDEVGLLAQTFNSMVRRIRNWRDELENAVKERTCELNRSNKELKKEITERKHAEKIQSVLFRISESVGASDDLDELFVAIRRQLSRLIDTNNIFIALYDPERDLYSFPYYIDEFDGADDVSPQQLPNSLTDYVRRTGQPLMVDEEVDKRLRKEKQVGMVGTPSAIWLGVPLKTIEGVIGVMAVQHYTDPSCYSEKDLDLLIFVSDHIAMAIERKRSEEELKLSKFTIEHSSESMFWIGPDARFLLVNNHACKALGYSREELLSMTVHDIDPNFPEEIWPDHWQELREKGFLIAETIHRTKSGNEYPVEVSANYLEYDGEEYNFTFARDITERKKVDRIKDEFVSVVSHELRTPLTSIHGSLDLIKQGKAGLLPKKARDLLEIASRNSNRLRELIENLLDIQKIESGKIKFDMKPLDLKLVLETSLENNKSFGEQFNVEFVFDDIMPDARVNADSSRLKQVMDNLLSNAAKFSPPHGEVGVSMTRNKDRIRVSIRDNGPGIPEEFWDKIFQRFTQADSSKTREKGGTGLGLSIAKSIIEQHGGKIGFETELNIGTTFYFELPEWRGPNDP